MPLARGAPAHVDSMVCLSVRTVSVGLTLMEDESVSSEGHFIAIEIVSLIDSSAELVARRSAEGEATGRSW